MDDLGNRPTVDFLILADRAEAIGGKLYMMGGAWEELAVADFGQPSGFSIAVGILVPWNATNQQHNVELQVQDADGNGLTTIGANFVAGRPPTMTAGNVQRLVMAINGHFMLPGPGNFAVVASINGQEARRTSFTAHPAPQPPPPA